MNSKGWRYFLKVCKNITDEKMLGDLFELLLTPEERASLETRCLIIKELLDQKKPQRQISDDLKVSIAKITRGSNELKRTSEKIKIYLKKQLT